MSKAFANVNYPNLTTLTFSNLTLATVGISAGIALINLSKKVSSDISFIDEEIMRTTKMRIVLVSIDNNEKDDIKRKVQNQLIKWAENGSGKQEDSSEIPTIINLMKTMGTQK